MTYTILGLSPLRVKEVVRGDGIHSPVNDRSSSANKVLGVSCGATDLNKLYVDQVKHRLSGERERLEASPNSKSFERTVQSLEYHFETVIKSRYDGMEHNVEWVSVPGLAENESKGFEQSEMEVTR